MTAADLSPEQNELLDEIVLLWKTAEELRDSAETLETVAKNDRMRADEKDELAESLWKPLAQSTPEWEDMLRNGEDPREAEA